MMNPVQCGLLAMFSALAFPLAVLAQELPRVDALNKCFIPLPANLAPQGGTDCGYVVVRENRSKESAHEVRLAYMRLRAVAASGAPPLFMLAGGPGQTIIQDANLQLFQPGLLGDVLQDRDVVLLEQRGTVRSKPALDCPENTATSFDAIVRGLDAKAAAALELDRLRGCIARHEKAGVDFSAYNTVESAADVNDVRAALGYDQIAYYGASYGTLLGQYVMRQFPERVAAVVLDGTDALSSQSWIENRARSAQWGIDNLTRLCAAQPGCAEAFDIPALVDEALALFKDGDIEFSVPFATGSPDATEFHGSISEGDFAQLIYGLQESKYGVAALPVELTQLIAGGRAAIGEMLGTQAAAAAEAARNGSEIEMMTLMHAAMVCSDDPVRSLEEIKTDGTGRYAQQFARSVGQLYVDLCAAVDVPQLPDALDADVDTDVPVLVLSGGLDVQTPYFLRRNACHFSGRHPCPDIQHQPLRDAGHAGVSEQS